MEPVYSLAYLTSAPLDAPDAVLLAHRLGYGAVGLRALPAAPGGEVNPLLHDPAAERETRARLADTGVTLFDMEIVRIGPDFRVEDVAAFLDLCGRLSARAVLVAGDDPDEARLIQSYAAFCAAARPYGLTADLEFMPWTHVPDAKTALRIVTAAGAPNGGILVDALHTARSATTLADLAAIPRHLLHYAQMCDAPAEVPATTEGLIHTARAERLLPGDGGIDLAGMFSVLPRDLPISLELPNVTEKPRLGIEEWARLALERARRVVHAIEQRRPVAV
ncbi:sugar phosphate isomerase/epimerase family protein [Xanthobacter versatilis]|uniref:sugar phosphate isomerase/epimerase family protein n=1 Tax=Xanthobacter autotrophicus (strain ATCC BAA-1158 / Py2) TaxID=78245 RepID=UPI00372B7660